MGIDAACRIFLQTGFSDTVLLKLRASGVKCPQKRTPTPYLCRSFSDGTPAAAVILSSSSTGIIRLEPCCCSFSCKGQLELKVDQDQARSSSITAKKHGGARGLCSRCRWSRDKKDKFLTRLLRKNKMNTLPWQVLKKPYPIYPLAGRYLVPPSLSPCTCHLS